MILQQQYVCATAKKHPAAISYAYSFFNTILDRALFKQKRDAQLDAIKRIIVMDGFDKQYKMINVVLEKLFKVMSYFH